MMQLASVCGFIINIYQELFSIFCFFVIHASAQEKKLEPWQYGHWLSAEEMPSMFPGRLSTAMSASAAFTTVASSSGRVP